jgi:hypothetical protein
MWLAQGGPGAPDLAAHDVKIDHFWYEGDAAPVNNCPQYGCVVDESTVYVGCIRSSEFLFSFDHDVIVYALHPLHWWLHRLNFIILVL